MRKSFIFSVLLCLTTALPAFAAKGGSDKMFVTKASAAGACEIKMGQLAQDKSSDSDLKSFGDTLVKDHTKASDQLKSIADSKGLKTQDRLTPEAQTHYDMLSKMEGAKFNKSFSKHMVSGHEKAIALFEKEASSGRDADLKKFAADTLPTLKEHLQTAKGLCAKLTPHKHKMK